MVRLVGRLRGPLSAGHAPTRIPVHTRAYKSNSYQGTPKCYSRKDRGRLVIFPLVQRTVTELDPVAACDSRAVKLKGHGHGLTARKNLAHTAVRPYTRIAYSIASVSSIPCSAHSRRRQASVHCGVLVAMCCLFGASWFRAILVHPETREKGSGASACRCYRRTCTIHAR